MKKFVIFTILVALSGVLRAQTNQEGLQQTDDAIKSLATELAKKLNEKRAETVALGQFTYIGGGSLFNSYLNNQLTGELLDVRGGSFTLTSAGDAQWRIFGEIVPIGDILRIYSRLVRSEGNTVVSQTHVDLALNPTITSMLSSGGGSYNSFVMADEWESDSLDAPLTYGAGTQADASLVNRTIHGGDEDWFLIESTGVASLVAETTGEMDTYMTLYDADTHEELASNDDGGNGSNATIRYLIRPGKKYIAMVRGYSSDTTGNYGFRAYTEEVDFGESTSYQIGDINSSRFVMQTLSGSRNLFLLTPGTDGTMVVETTGHMDVMMDLYDAETYELLASDDDSGHDSNARITHEVRRGRRYFARVRAYSDERGEYGFKAYME